MRAPATSVRFLFDLAGVLVRWDPEPLFAELLDGDREALDRFFATVMSRERQRQISIGRPMREVLDEAARAHPEYAAVLPAWRARWPEMLHGPIEGSLAVLGELRERGYPVYLLGNWSREEYEWARRRLDFLATLDGVLLSGDCGIAKPEPGIFALAVQRFALVPERTVFVDDSRDNVAAALALGFNALRFEDPRQLYRVLMDYRLL